jgi:hypothetical protein
MRNVAIGAFLGFVLIAVILVIRYMLNDTFNPLRMWRNILGSRPWPQCPKTDRGTGETGIIRIPTGKERQVEMSKMDVRAMPQPDYFVQSELDRLRVNVGFAGTDKKVIMVTSSVPNEGKSFVAPASGTSWPRPATASAWWTRYAEVRPPQQPAPLYGGGGEFHRAQPLSCRLCRGR